MIESLVTSAQPCQYKLGWDPEVCSITVCAAKEAWQDVLYYLKMYKPSKRYSKLLCLPGFVASLERGFGFGEPMLLPRTDGSANVPKYHLPLPVIEYERDKQGMTFYDHRAGQTAVLSLGLVLNALRYTRETRPIPGEQLGVVEISHLGASLHSCPLDGEVSHTVLKWLASFGTRVVMVNVDKAMKQAWAHMFKAELSYGTAEAYPDGAFWLMAPGSNCACIGMDGGERGNLALGFGAPFCDHNLDSVGQQLTILAGFAAMLQEAEAAILSVQEN